MRGVKKVMQTDKTKKIEKILTVFTKIDKLPMAIIKYGTHISLLLLAFGTLIIVYNQTIVNFDVYLSFVARCIIKTSFTILAESIIGGLLIDFVFKKA